MRFSRFSLNRNRARIKHNPGNFSVDRAARVNYAPLRARKITRVFAAAVATGGREGKERGRQMWGGNFAVFRQGSFRLFWLQPSGCRYHHNFRGAAPTASVQPISTPHYPFAVIPPFATAPQRIRNRQLRHRSIHPIR